MPKGKITLHDRIHAVKVAQGNANAAVDQLGRAMEDLEKSKAALAEYINAAGVEVVATVEPRSLRDLIEERGA